MKMIASLPLFFLVIFPLKALEIGQLLPQWIGETKWQKVVYEDGVNHFVAKFPGELVHDPLTNQKCVLHSFHENNHYAIHVSKRETPLPETVEEFMHTFDNLTNKEMIAIESPQPLIRYVLQIYFFNEDQGGVQTVCRVYATDQALYFAIVEGHDFSLAEKFFQAFQIRSPKKG